MSNIQPPWLRDPRDWSPEEDDFMQWSARWYNTLQDGELSHEEKKRRLTKIESQLDRTRHHCPTIPDKAAVAPRHYYGVSSST